METFHVRVRSNANRVERIAGDADELAMNQYSARGGGGGDQLIIGTAAAARACGTPPVCRYV